MSVYTWGSNKQNQQPSEKSLHSYIPVSAINQLNGQVPISVAAGDGHTLILCESGDIYSFGRNKEGQLGHDSLSSTATDVTDVQQNIVVGLEHEQIISIAAGSLNSFAITSRGQIFHWGLVHVDNNYDGRNDETKLNAGELTGLAQDQQTFMVSADAEARSVRSNHMSTASGMQRGARVSQSRQLRDIVNDSTERWLMSIDDADEEYLEELDSMGYHKHGMTKNPVKSINSDANFNRDAEYRELLSRGCKCRSFFSPRRIPNLDNINVVSVSAGYAHVMIVSRDGYIFAAGYNDRGQLGLGHRISTSSFKKIDHLANKFVVEVVCGQQHTICRAVDRPDMNSSSSSVQDSSLSVGSAIGADVYVWGNGILGQLGIGRKGTTMGRLLPTLLTGLNSLYPMGIISVAAGANFSVVVANDGLAYSFGHSEYNQHGTGNQSHSDYTDPYYYFEPRLVKIPDVLLRSVVCGAAYTIGCDQHGNLYSWGWNESGVLGHGKNHFASSPTRISSIGKAFDGCSVIQTVAGAKHVVALTASHSNAWASTYIEILYNPTYYDCMLVLDSNQQYPCHQAMLSARSNYFKGYLSAARREKFEENNYQKLIAVEMKFDSMDDLEAPTMVSIILTGPHANSISVKYLLEYIYLDKIQVPYHKRHELMKLADECGLHRLHQILKQSTQFTSDVPAIGDGDLFETLFMDDIDKLWNNLALHADVVFAISSPTNCANSENEIFENEMSHLYPLRPFLFAHRCILCRIPYFATLLSSQFEDSKLVVNAKHLDPTIYNQSFQVIDLDGIVNDGVEIETIKRLIGFAYNGKIDFKKVSQNSLRIIEDEVVDGEEEEEDLEASMALLVAANRFGFTNLIQYCEKQISLHLIDFFPSNAENCLAFAERFNLFGLVRRCKALLARN